MAAHNRPIKTYKIATVVWLCCIACLGAFLFASCGPRPSPEFRETATTILNNMDESMEKLRGFQEEIQKENNIESDDNPSLLMYREILDQLHVFEIRLRLYRKEVKKRRSADSTAEKQLRIVRDTYRDCAVVLFTEVQDQLPDYHVNLLFKNVPAYSEEIIAAISGGLGVEAHTTPPAESCALYKKRGADFRREYNLTP